LISKHHKAIFIHIEKTAGTSIEKKLGLFEDLQRGVQDHSKLRYYEHIASLSYSLRNLKYVQYALRRGKFSKALLYLSNMIIPELTKKEYKSYYKFTFVRNTWSRIYSFYYNVMNDETLKRNYNISEDCSLFEFVKNKINPGDFSQLEYIRDNSGNCPLNFIGRFENLDADFKKVCQSLNIQNSNLPRLLITPDKAHYTEFYDHKTKDLVRQLFKAEIDFFNFKFGGS